MAVQTSSIVTVDITFRVTCDLDALTQHVAGGDLGAPFGRLGDPERALVDHITWPIVHNSFDTPAAIERIHWSGDVA